MKISTSRSLTLVGATLALSLVASAQQVEPTDPPSVTLTGVMRDFLTEHPDMESYPSMNFTRYNRYDGVYPNLVMSTLDVEGKPQFNQKLLLDRSWSDIPLTSAESLAQWYRDVPGVNVSWLESITLQRQAGSQTYVFAKERPDYWWPADGKGFGNSTGNLRWAEPGSHNYHFTFELDTVFTYSDPATRDYPLTFSFTGDDDVWVYINGKLAVDIGGVHPQAFGSVNLDEQAANLGLVAGGQYQLKLFMAERHTSECNFRIETTLRLRKAKLPTVTTPFD